MPRIKTEEGKPKGKLLQDSIKAYTGEGRYDVGPVYQASVSGKRFKRSIVQCTVAGVNNNLLYFVCVSMRVCM